MVGRPEKLGLDWRARDLRRLHIREAAAMASTASTAPATAGMNQPVLSPSHQCNIRKAPIKQWLRMTACAFTSAATELLHRVLSTLQQIPSSMMRL